MARGFEQHVAEYCGVTVAGLRFLVKFGAAGFVSRKRGSEAAKLQRDGMITIVRIGDVGCLTSITDAGREVVKRARSMGW